MSSELWLAEGFTQVLRQADRRSAPASPTCSAPSQALTEFVETAAVAPGRAVRSAEEMSRMAPFMDGGTTVDRTNWPNSVTSYYPLGGAIALALDLTLRGRSGSEITLDDFMRAMWRVHGKPGGAREGYVDRPYTAADAEARLAEVSGDAAFARDFFSRYIQGREAADYPALLAGRASSSAGATGAAPGGATSESSRGTAGCPLPRSSRRTLRPMPPASSRTMSSGSSMASR